MGETPRVTTRYEPEITGSLVVAERRDDGTPVPHPDDPDRAGTEERARELAERQRDTLDQLAGR